MKVYKIVVMLQRILNKLQWTPQITLEDIKEHSLKVETAVKNRVLYPSETNYAFIAHLLLLTTTKKIQKFDLLLKITEETAKQFVSIFIDHLHPYFKR